MGPLLDALRQLGGAARPKQVSELIAQTLKLSPEQVSAKIKSGTERFHNQVCWARQYLVWEGLLDGAKRGEWKLTDIGARTRLTDADARQVFLKWVEIHQRTRKSKPDPEESAGGPEAATPEETDEPTTEEELLAVIQALPPSGFERLCMRLLHEWGFEDIKVLGKSHDGGVDGTAVLRLNAFVSFDVAFQCKRYRGAVSRDQVAGFRGSKKALHAEKLILITTGHFTAEAIKEAKGEGAVAVELVDGDRLIELFTERKLGLRREEVIKVDHSFFEQFRQEASSPHH